MLNSHERFVNPVINGNLIQLPLYVPKSLIPVYRHCIDVTTTPQTMPVYSYKFSIVSIYHFLSIFFFTIR